MNLKSCITSILLSLSLFSCKDEKPQATEEQLKINNVDTSHEVDTEIAAVIKDSLIKNLQGKWKETQYPFRLAEFKNTTVKFTEEGVVEEPTFLDFEIANECRFEVNNLKNAVANDVFLVIPKTQRCEILKINDDTLALGGFNISSNSNYSITYKKVQ